MQFQYMKEDVGYEEFILAVCEADTEGSEGKIVSAKAKALTVKKVTENRDQNELKDLRQQIESLATIMESATVGNNKPKMNGGVSKCLENLSWRELVKAAVTSPSISPGSTPIQTLNQNL